MQNLESIFLFILILCALIWIFNSLVRKEKERPSSENNKTYNGQKVYTTRSGYEYIYNRQGQPVYVHRIQAMKMLGRYLKNDEVVHHKDEDPSNNEFSNLEIMTRKQHNRHHRRQPKNVIKRHFKRSLNRQFKRSFRIRWY